MTTSPFATIHVPPHINLRLLVPESLTPDMAAWAAAVHDVNKGRCGLAHEYKRSIVSGETEYVGCWPAARKASDGLLQIVYDYARPWDANRAKRERHLVLAESFKRYGAARITCLMLDDVPFGHWREHMQTPEILEAGLIVWFCDYSYSRGEYRATAKLQYCGGDVAAGSVVLAEVTVHLATQVR